MCQVRKHPNTGPNTGPNMWAHLVGSAQSKCPKCPKMVIGLGGSESYDDSQSSYNHLGTEQALKYDGETIEEAYCQERVSDLTK